MQGDRPLLAVTEIAPGGDEISAGTVRLPLAGGRLHIALAFLGAAGDRAPAAGARADPGFPAGGAQLVAPAGEGRVRLVAPGQADEIGGHLPERLGVFEGDVGPELRPAAERGDHGADAADEGEVHRRTPLAAYRLPGAPLTDVEGLVAADVHQRAGEVGHQLAEQILDQGQRSGIARAEAEGPGAGDQAGEIPLLTGGDLGQRRIAGMLQPAGEMPEAVLVGAQLDAVQRAPVVELPDVGGGDRRGVSPDLLVPGIGEGVLGVELQVVDLPARQPGDELAQLAHGRHAVAADVQHHPAGGEVRLIADQQARQAGAVLGHQLRQGA